MFDRRFPQFATASFFAFGFLCLTDLGLAQENSTQRPPVAARAKPVGKLPSPLDVQDPAKRTAVIDKMIAEYDLTPHPLPSIPENPPPHEGAMISLPYMVEPPDIIVVEILEALPGRPVSGERLVRPDGTIALGFYGDLQVRGLTAAQIKVAIIKHMRTFLLDEDLGLVEFQEPDMESLPMDAPPPPPARDHGLNPFEPHPAQDPKHKVPPGAAPNRKADTVESTVIEPRRPPGPLDEDAPGAFKIVPPQVSTRVYVDVSAYNSMTYYVLGDVTVPGRLPCTGKETVLDALNHAGGLLPTADPKQISLVRPERNGKPAKVYNVDLEAIQKRGEVATNYQIFPGDRLFVERDEVVKKTVEIDRLTHRFRRSSARCTRKPRCFEPHRSQAPIMPTSFTRSSSISG